MNELKGYRLEYKKTGSAYTFFSYNPGRNEDEAMSNLMKDEGSEIVVTKVEMVDKSWSDLVRQMGSEG